MELKGSFLQRFKIGETQLPPFVTRRRDSSLLLVGMFTREKLSSQYNRWKSLEVHCNNDPNIRHPHISPNGYASMPELSFTRLQPTDEDYIGVGKRAFGLFIAREAILDEEYWTAAWLRAEARWEHIPDNMRNVSAYKRRFAEAEFYDLKRRCSGRVGNSLQCFCFVAVRKEDKNIRRTVLKSVVGTLDLSIRQFIHGETYPEEAHRRSAVMASQELFNTHRYAYIANVSVALFARRQGIATNMLYLVIDVAKRAGMKQLFAHVSFGNKAAQDLYKKVGFQVVETVLSSSGKLKDDLILLSMDL